MGRLDAATGEPVNGPKGMEIERRESDGAFEGNEVPAADFVAAMRANVTAVNLVTTDGAAGRFGLTVSAVSSVSAEPPLILACLNRRSPAVSAIGRNGVFCVNALNADQAHIADCFAGRPRDDVRPFDFACGSWLPGRSGAPELAGAVASLDCTVFARHSAGSHEIFIGRVLSVISRALPPLLYWDRRYGKPHPLIQ
ncbi:MAG TPA: flavin reductase family protein [Terriglobia bacterium]|nr:flavin reductase family protein [Terriglobia bacterium]